MTMQVFYVADMRCASCVAKIERAFAASEAIEARVDLAGKQVLVEGDISAQRAIAIIAGAGYDAERVADARMAVADKIIADKALYRRRLIQATMALMLGGPMMLWGLLGGEMMVVSSSQRLGWGLMGLLSLVLLLTTGLHFYQGTWRALQARSANMDTLIALGTSTAWAYSMLVVLAPGWFPADTRHVYFEASVMILGLINLGQALELRAKGRTSEAVQRLVGLQSSKAIKIGTDGDEQVEISLLQPGDRLRLRPGDRVALDGVVESGQSQLDESMLTGEPLPVIKDMGDSLSAGTINGNGSIIYRVTAAMRDTRLSKIIALVQQAQTSKVPIGRLTDKVASYFVPLVILVALIAAGAWYLAGPVPRLSHALVVLTSVLIIACPCALGLATPMSIMVAVGRAAQMGVLIKSGEALQLASRVTCVVLDKTGTLTLGQPRVADIRLIGAVTEAFGARDTRVRDRDTQDTVTQVSAARERGDSATGQILASIASLEQYSEHHLAAAIVAEAKSRGLALCEPADFRNFQGRGIVGVLDAQEWAIGNLSLMQSQGVAGLESQSPWLSEWAAEGKTPVYVARNGQLLATVAIADPIKPDAARVVASLRDSGLRLVLLTGDNGQTAGSVAMQLGIAEVIAEVPPEQKQQHILALKERGEVVAMVGDGINDAPALVSADVGIAMGTGTQVAIESADLTLLSTRLQALPDTLALARATITNIKQNLFGAFIYNSLGIPIAAGLLYPLTGILLSPVIAGGAMALSSLTVVTNANRLRKLDLG